MTWDDVDWAVLDRLRERFLSGSEETGPYWDSESDLASYDLTFGERIGWKWDAVLDELRMRRWAPPGGTVLDWGCGSGIAGRRVIRSLGAGTFTSLVVWDHSPLASAYADRAAGREFPGLKVSAATSGYLGGDEPIGVLVLSHVLNELSSSAIESVRALAARAHAILWTEPGSRETSRMLGALRDEFARDFRVVAPCTHQNACPILRPGNERHWCHHFAAPPPAVFTDSNWGKFGRRAGIDLRSLPYSFIALDRGWAGDAAGLSRVIGRPEQFKPYTRLLNCDGDGLAELLVQKRDAAALIKDLERRKRPLVYRWTREGTRITGGCAVDA